MKITRYQVVDSPEESGEGHLFENYEEAKTLARNRDGCVVEHTYEWADSELVDDFRPQCDTCAAHEGDEKLYTPASVTSDPAWDGRINTNVLKVEIKENENGDSLCQVCTEKEQAEVAKHEAECEAKGL